jgi:flagellar hook-associated protein 1 FlgK
VDVHDRILPGLGAALDAAVGGVRDAVNGFLGNGWDLDGQPGSALFSGSGASDVQAVLTDPRKLALAAGSLTSDGSVMASGTLDLQAALASQDFAIPPAASGVLRVNGTDVSWTDQTTPSELMDALRGAGVSASYDASSGRFTLLRDPSAVGGPDLAVSDVSGNLSSVLRLDTAGVDKGIPGDGSVAASIASLLVQPRAGAQTVIASLQGVATSAAAKAGNARAAYQAADRLRASLDETRASTSGVNTDEEGIKMLQFQRSYEAAARLASIQDSMLDTLINKMM